jgi:hypothetical protein
MSLFDSFSREESMVSDGSLSVWSHVGEQIVEFRFCHRCFILRFGDDFVDLPKIKPTPTPRHSDDAAIYQKYNYISWTDAFCNYHRYLSEPSVVPNLAGIDLDPVPFPHHNFFSTHHIETSFQHSFVQKLPRIRRCNISMIRYPMGNIVPWNSRGFPMFRASGRRRGWNTRRIRNATVGRVGHHTPTGRPPAIRRRLTNCVASSADPTHTDNTSRIVG